MVVGRKPTGSFGCRKDDGSWILAWSSLATGRTMNVTAVERVSHYNSAFFLPGGSGLGMTSLIEGTSKPYLMDRDGRNKRDVSGGTDGFTYGLNASPDGELISYHEDYQVFLANADGTQQRRIETGNPFNFSPRWSPDGQWLLFLSGAHGASDPYIVRRDGSDFRKLADAKGYQGWMEFLDVPDFHAGSSDVPAWGAGGKWVYFARASDQGGTQIVRCDLEGNIERLTDGASGVLDYQPVPSPDGNWVCFGSNRSGRRQLYVMRTDGRDVEPLTEVGVGHGAMWPHWQPVP